MWSYNNELYHYGVLGMKWGRRKNKSTINNSKEKSKNVKKDDLVKKSKSYEKTNSHKIMMDMAVDALLNKNYKLYDEIIKFDADQGKKWAKGYFNEEAYKKKDQKSTKKKAAISSMRVTQQSNNFVMPRY